MKKAKDFNTTAPEDANKRKAKELRNMIKKGKHFPDLKTRNWTALPYRKRVAWIAAAGRKAGEIYKEIRKTEAAEKEKRRAQHLNFLEKDGMANSSRFRRWKQRECADPDGEAVLSKDQKVLVSDEEVRARYQEYYEDLFKGEEDRTIPPNEEDRKLWMDARIIANNEDKLRRATKGKSVVEQIPTLEEYLEIIRKGDPMSAGGDDRLQYGVLQKLSLGTHMAIVGLIGVWWRTAKIPVELRVVQFCSLHKRGDRLDLFNKRGIGLISKLVIIMKTVLLNRVNEALDMAGTRSLAQRGARKGVHTCDIVVALVNAIHHAKRTGKTLHIVEFDLVKFFDKISHRAFTDAYTFFGFNEQEIKLYVLYHTKKRFKKAKTLTLCYRASVFWKHYVGRARTRYGFTDPFPVNIGNVQGLAGSPSRSSLFLDLCLLYLERGKMGYKFTTDNFAGKREHELDELLVVLYALGWVDDVSIVEETFDGIKKAVSIYNRFANYYGLRFGADKCHHYVVNDDEPNANPLQITDFNGVTSNIDKVDPIKVFRSLGVFLNLNLDWTGHAEQILGKLSQFSAKIGKHWSPAWLTAKIVNSNAVPAISYGMSVVSMKDREIKRLQDAIIKPVRKDANSTRFAPHKAYTLPLEDGGFNLASVEAVYKATKIAGVHHFLNSNYQFAAQTTQMLLLDLQRKLRCSETPLGAEDTIWRRAKKDEFPEYFQAAHKALKDIGGAITPKVMWDLERLTVRTFANCIAEWDTDSNMIEVLESVGIVYMNQLSSWFVKSSQWGGEPAAPITIAAIHYGMNKGFALLEDTLIHEALNIEGVGEVRSAIIINMVKKGARNILTSKVPFSFVNNKYKKGNKWNALRFNGIGEKEWSTGRWYTDGSKKDEKAAFAVVDNELNLIFSARIIGRITSQRAELFGLLVAAYLGPLKVKVSDPYYIIRTIKKILKREVKQYGWNKIDNRSLLREIADLSKGASNFFEWVKTHQKDNITVDGEFNAFADLHAKAALDKKPTALVESWAYVDEYFITFSGKLFEGDIRREAHNKLLEEEQSRFKSEDRRERFAHKNWWMEIPKSTDLSKYGALRFKIFSRTLLTHDRLAKSYPGLYNNLVCPACGICRETDVHMFTECGAYTNTKWETWTKIEEIIAQTMEISETEVRNKFRNWIATNRTNDEEGKGMWFLAGIPERIKTVVLSKRKKSEAINMWQKVHTVVMSAIHDIWIARCEFNRKRNWTFAELKLDFIEDALILENKLLQEEWDGNDGIDTEEE